MENEPHRIRVLVVDNHPLVRRALSDLLECYSDMPVIGTAEDGHSAIDATNNLSPDVILLDVELPGLSGIEVARQLHRAVPSLRIIMLTNYDTQYVEQVTGGCADAYLSKSGTHECIGEAIRGVYRGRRGNRETQWSVCGFSPWRELRKGDHAKARLPYPNLLHDCGRPHR